ncbi:hypothetical protein P9112_000206 [Eukaryota sp. TZLM1-RC]
MSTETTLYVHDLPKFVSLLQEMSGPDNQVKDPLRFLLKARRAGFPVNQVEDVYLNSLEPLILMLNVDSSLLSLHKAPTEPPLHVFHLVQESIEVDRPDQIARNLQQDLLVPDYVDIGHYQTFMKLLPQYTSTNLLLNYHSNVLPLINSTGMGKTRFMIETCSRLQNDTRYKSSYFTFPRYSKTGDILDTWPPSDPSVISFVQSLVPVACQQGERGERVKMFVYACQCIIIASFLAEQPTDWKGVTQRSEYVEAFHNVVDHAKELFNGHFRQNEPISDMTETLVQLLQQNHSREFVYVLFADEVSSLIDSSAVSLINNCLNTGTNGMDSEWNLYRCLRHAARNLFTQHFQLLVVVAGTHTSLRHFCDDAVKEGAYRTPMLKPYMVSHVHRGTTLPPLSTGMFQLFPPQSQSGYFETMVSPLLSLRNAVSCRPLWLTYALNSSSLMSFASQVNLKVKNAFNSTVLPKDAAIVLSLILEGVAIHESLLSHFVHCSFAVIKFFPSNFGNRVFSYLLPTVDPILSHFAWNYLHLKANAPWQSTLIDIMKELLTTHVAPTTLGVLIEPVCVGVLLYLFQFSQFNFNSLIQIPANFQLFSHLYPIPLRLFLEENCHCYRLPSSENTRKLNAAGYISICESMLTTVDLQEPQDFYFMLLGAFIHRTIVVLPPGTADIDAIVPVVFKPSESHDFPTVEEIVKAIRNNYAADYLGVLQIQIKTGEIRPRKNLAEHLRTPRSIYYNPEKPHFSASLLLSIQSTDFSTVEFSPRRPLEDDFFYVLNNEKFQVVATAVQDFKAGIELAHLGFQTDDDYSIVWTRSQNPNRFPQRSQSMLSSSEPPKSMPRL